MATARRHLRGPHLSAQGELGKGSGWVGEGRGRCPTPRDLADPHRLVRARAGGGDGMKAAGLARGQRRPCPSTTPRASGGLLLACPEVPRSPPPDLYLPSPHPPTPHLHLLSPPAPLRPRLRVHPGRRLRQEIQVAPVPLHASPSPQN